VPDPLREAADKLQSHLDQALAAGQTIPASDLASFVSALALAKLALAERPDSAPQASNASKDESTEMPVTHGMPIAESVVDYPADEIRAENETRATDDFLWRRELESLWRKHITKDEFHRPVVRSLGLPVLVIVDHVRSGRSWKSICENYPGLVSDDIRAAVSMATECGWLSED
jgi:uncharacterized protein (DUF433 family)